MGVLQITPVRASRALALRFLAHRLGMDLGRVVMLALAPEVQKGQAGAPCLGPECPLVFLSVPSVSLREEARAAGFLC